MLGAATDGCNDGANDTRGDPRSLTGGGAAHSPHSSSGSDGCNNITNNKSNSYSASGGVAASSRNIHGVAAPPRATFDATRLLAGRSVPKAADQSSKAIDR